MRISYLLSPFGVAVLVVTSTTAGAVDMPSPPTWAYSSTAEGVRSVATSLSLGTDQPQDLVEEVSYRGTQRRYGQIRYGSENSRRIVVVIDELGDGQFDCYVDADRDRIISSAELVAGKGRTRTLELDTEVIREDKPIQAARRVELRRGVIATRMSIATLGCIEGLIDWTCDGDDQPARIRVRRIDGNANGLFADARDRLQMDLDNDRKWNAIQEQFSWLPVLTIAGRRYAARSDRFGERFELSEITGVGKLRVVVAKMATDARIIGFEAMIFSEDGAAYSLKQPDTPQEVPVGRYTLGSVTLTIDNDDGEPWHFVFARSGKISESDWAQVVADRDVSLEAIGETRFVLSTSTDKLKPGGVITVNPRMYTQHGLLITLSCRGRRMGSFDSARSHNRCNIKLVSADGGTLNSAQSGFA